MEINKIWKIGKTYYTRKQKTNQWQIIAKQTEVAENPKSKHKLKN
jgi:hypothetical protein